MKNLQNIFITLLLLVTFTSYGQGGIAEKLMDKYKVETAAVLGHTFNVGDTLTLNIGSLEDGRFLSTKMNPLVFGGAEYLPARYAVTRFIISKIWSATKGLNEYVTIVYYNPEVRKQTKYSQVHVDIKVAILKDELILE